MKDPTSVLVVPHPCLALSHIMTFTKIGRAAVERGYSFTYLLSQADVDALEEIGLDDLSISIYPGAYNRSECLEIAAQYSDLSPIQVAMLYASVGVKTCKNLLSHDPTLGNFDMFFGDLSWPCSSLVADRMDHQQKSKIPRLMFQGNIAIDPWCEYYGVPSPANEIPQVMGSARWLLGRSEPMSFLSRFANTLLREVSRLVVSLVMLRPYTALRKEANLEPYDIIKSMQNSSALVVMPAVWAIEPPRALPPNWKVVHPILPSPAKPVMGNIGSFIETSCVDKGLVVVSFGTQASLSVGQIETILQAVSALQDDYCFVWRLSKRNVGSQLAEDLVSHHNLLTVEWMPQNDLLGHPKTRAFVSHVGYGSLYEAAYHGVPIVGIPMFGDQEDNIHRAVQTGWGTRLDKNHFTGSDLVYAIRKAGPSMQTRAQEVSLQVKAGSGVNEVLDWMDYARIHGVDHLMPYRAMKSSYFAYYNLDVALVLIGVVLLALGFVKRLVMKKQAKKVKQKAA